MQGLSHLEEDGMQASMTGEINSLCWMSVCFGESGLLFPGLAVRRFWMSYTRVTLECQE